ncbi:hypothetical protein [Streptomyces sp. NPDC101150]|uniref:hypothetical protein n=1 Tax=Streptomyces sp. NPDC101150 TaxID=3366114 RepID=UPI00382E05D3
MASLAAIRDALKATIEANVSGIRGYDTVPDVTNLPAFVIQPVAGDFTGAFARGMDEWTFDLYVLVSSADSRRSQEALDSYITGAGSSSIRQALFSNSDLGLSGVDAFVSGVRGYGGSYESASIHHIGAILRVCVYTPGTA